MVYPCAKFHCDRTTNNEDTGGGGGGGTDAEKTKSIISTKVQAASERPLFV